jgi:hypothetical protein
MRRHHLQILSGERVGRWGRERSQEGEKVKDAREGDGTGEGMEMQPEKERWERRPALRSAVRRWCRDGDGMMRTVLAVWMSGSGERERSRVEEV